MPVPRTLPGGRVKPQTLPVGANGRPLCRWCQLEILALRRRTFCSDYCVDQHRLRTDPGYLRERVFARDRGLCSLCAADTVAIYAALKRARGKARASGLSLYGMQTITSRRSLWDADHIIPVVEGGGQCDLANLRTLCLPCHREVTADLRRRLRSGVMGRRTGPVLLQSGSARSKEARLQAIQPSGDCAPLTKCMAKCDLAPPNGGSTYMPALKDFITRLGKQQESICSTCCQIVRPSTAQQTLLQAQAAHRCGEFSLNTVTR